jgi:hypothetical protein
VTGSRATCTLQTAGLRWRYRGSQRVVRRADPRCEQQRTGVRVMPDPVVRHQTPAAGLRVPSHSVVVIDDDCTALLNTDRRCE